LLTVAMSGLVGLVVGSFLGALAARWPALDRSFILGRSRCAACGASLGWRETVPLWSWLRQRGRCRQCNAAIGWLPLLAEVAAAAIVVIAWATLAPAAAMLATLLGWWLLLLALVDAEHGRLPDVLTLPLLALGLAAAALAPLPGLASPLDSALGAALGFLVFYLVARLYAAWRGRPGLGLGDAKLLAALGAWLGVAGLAPLILTAALAGLGVALASGKRRPEDAIAFGPCLALAGGGLLWWRLLVAA
jgi:leader peptidase (prepilin peptidase) / N-methyltransferase